MLYGKYMLKPVKTDSGSSYTPLACVVAYRLDISTMCCSQNCNRPHEGVIPFMGGNTLTSASSMLMMAGLWQHRY